MAGRWRRVTQGHPCSVCGHTSWCTVSEDGMAAHCMRIESGKAFAKGGWLHRLDRAADLPPITPPPAKIDAPALHLRCKADITTGRVRALATKLGLTPGSLQLMGIGWHAERQCYTFPMYDHERRVIGIRTRLPDGAKKAIAGSRNGIFVPSGMELRGPLLMPEGPTDAAALLMLGYSVIGRPDCQGGGELIVALLRRECGQQAPTLIVVSDQDAPGIAGATALQKRLKTAGFTAKLMLPPAGIKDAREWVNRGATRATIDRTIFK